MRRLLNRGIPAAATRASRPLAVRGLVPVLALVWLTACSPGGAVATVDGAPIRSEALDRLHPAGAEVDADERASSLLLLILHRLITRSAQEQFGFSVSQDAQQAAFDARTGGYGDAVDEALEARGVTRDRVLLEADLDVVRDELQKRLVRSGAPGLDIHSAYRTFLSTNSRVCLSALRVSDESALAGVQDLVDDGAGVDAVEASYPDVVERLDVECATPSQLGPGLASVALDADVGQAHVVQTRGGSVVAAVDERDAPPLRAVRGEVLRVAAETQGPELFNSWAAGVLRAADVEVSGRVGKWAPTDGTNGIPTVVPD